jgi:hypothetical protein
MFSRTHSPEAERNRRRDLVAGLRSRREGMLGSLRRGSAGGGGADAARAALLSGGAAPSSSAPRETAATAGLDTHGLLNLQRQTMARQDVELEGLERTVASTKVKEGMRKCENENEIWGCRMDGW